MTTLLRLLPTGPQWPYSVAQFRTDEPHLSISNDPHPGELASYAELEPPIMVFQVQSTAPPAYDPATHRAEEITPTCVNGVWQQTWQLIELPPPAPIINWDTFKEQALNSSVLNSILLEAYQTVPVAASALIPALLKVENNQFKDFEISWKSIVTELNISQEIINSFVASAEECNLPQEFINIINAG